MTPIAEEMTPSNNTTMDTEDDESDVIDNDGTEGEEEEEEDDESIDLAPSLWSTPSYYRITRKGKVLKNVSERYVRDDLGLGFCMSPSTTSSSSKHRFSTGVTRKISSPGELISLLCTPSSSNNSNTSTTAPTKRKRKRKKTSTTSTTAPKVTRIAICDTNVLLHNLDLLEHPSNAISNIVITQTALAECRHNSFTAYGRVVDLLRSSGETTTTTTADGGGGKRCAIFFPDVHHVDTQLTSNTTNKTTASPSINDENDLRIRQVCEFYTKSLKNTDVQVVLLTDDVGCRNKALEEQSKKKSKSGMYKACSVREYVRTLEEEDSSLSLLDVVAQFTVAPSSSTTTTSTTRSSFKRVFPPHLSSSELLLGVKSGQYFQGILRTERASSSGNFSAYEKCYVTIRRGDERIAVSVIGLKDVNRAVDGDLVALELHPVTQWIGHEKDDEEKEDSLKKKDEEKKKKEQTTNDTSGGATIAADTAEPNIRDEDNVRDSVLVPSSTSSSSMTELRPTGKVVGIVRRNFRKNYCGSIYTAVKTITMNVEENDAELSKEEEEEGEVTQDSKAEKKKKKKQKKKGQKNDENTTEDTTTPAQARKQQQQQKTEREKITSENEIEHPDGTTTCVFFAVDNRVPPILIRTTQRDRLLGKRVLVAIDSWPAESKYPLGHYVKTIGDAGKKDVETEVLLHEHDIPCDPFPAKVLACLPPDDYKIVKTPDRLDLRHLPVLSIDPPGCKDIDDALHCTVLPNGNYQVGVHIADVTNYVKAGTAIDLEAAKRSTSTYLVNKRLDMLPGLLTTDLCSLKGNVDRYAFSVLWEVTPEADIIDVDFRKTIIHSIAALTYQQAQGLIDQPEGDSTNDIQAGAVKRLASLARKFRARRIGAGALTLASPEVKFVLDSESLNPTDVQAYALFEANALVEEFMLLANVTVGKKILRHYPTLSVLRRHPAPNRGMFDSLISKAKCRGFAIDIEDSKRLADSLDAAQIEGDGYFNKLLRILSTRCMSPAQYFCSGEYKPTDWHHYGLAAPVYTHFTSPIRRYADVCVHRLLAAAIGVDPLPVHLSSKSYLHDLAANMNRRHRAAQLAGRASVQLHTLIFFSGDNSGKEEDAYILDVDTSEGVEPSFTVIVPRYGIEGRVRLSNISANDANLVREPELHRISYKDDATGKVATSIQVFEKVRVKIWVNIVQENQKELVVDLVEPKIGPTQEVSASSDDGELTGKGDANRTGQNTPPSKKRKK